MICWHHLAHQKSSHRPTLTWWPGDDQWWENTRRPRGLAPALRWKLGQLRHHQPGPGQCIRRAVQITRQNTHSMEEDEEMCLDKTIILFTMYTTWSRQKVLIDWQLANQVIIVWCLTAQLTEWQQGRDIGWVLSSQWCSDQMPRCPWCCDQWVII